jgi:hypothetical protein
VLRYFQGLQSVSLSGRHTRETTLRPAFTFGFSFGTNAATTTVTAAATAVAAAAAVVDQRAAASTCTTIL